MPNTTIQAAGEAMPAPINETPHDEIRRLSWRIADLLNGLDPRIDYVTICASGSGAHAVMTGFNIPLGDGATLATLFQQWKAAEQRAATATTDEEAAPLLAECEAITREIESRTPETMQDFAILLYVEAYGWTCIPSDRFKRMVEAIAEGETPSDPDGRADA